MSPPQLTPTFIHLHSLKTVALIEGDVLRTIRKSVKIHASTQGFTRVAFYDSLEEAGTHSIAPVLWENCNVQDIGDIRKAIIISQHRNANITSVQRSLLKENAANDFGSILQLNSRRSHHPNHTLCYYGYQFPLLIGSPHHGLVKGVIVVNREGDVEQLSDHINIRFPVRSQPNSAQKRRLGSNTDASTRLAKSIHPV